MSPALPQRSGHAGPEVVVAGGGVAGAATAIRLRRLGFAVRLLVRSGAPAPGIEAIPERALSLLEVIGEPGLVHDAGGVEVTGPAGHRMVHVDRTALARAFLARAVAWGATVEEVGRLPPVDTVAGAVAAIDATGRAAAWSRPLLIDGHDVAWQFEGPPDGDLALRVVRSAGWWAYRLGLPTATWVGVVVPAADATGATAEALLRLGLDQATLEPRGRRAARVQCAVQPVDGTRIAVGDAAMAQDPIAGGGIRFALSSAVAAATTVASWVAEPSHRDLAASYYTDLVAGEHRRHLTTRRAVHDGSGAPTVPEPEPVPDVVRFAARIVEAPVVVDGVIKEAPAVRLPDGTLTRWLGSFDLLVLARLAAEPVARLVLLARLQEHGLQVTAARTVVEWAVRHDLLADSDRGPMGHWDGS